MRRRRRRLKTARPVMESSRPLVAERDFVELAGDVELPTQAVVGTDPEFARPSPPRQPFMEVSLPTCCGVRRERHLWGSTVAIVTVHTAACPDWSSR